MPASSALLTRHFAVYLASITSLLLSVCGKRGAASVESCVFLAVRASENGRASRIGDYHDHKSHPISILMRDGIGDLPFRSRVHRYSCCLLIKQVHIGARVFLSSLLCLLSSLTNALPRILSANRRWQKQKLKQRTSLLLLESKLFKFTP